VKIRSILLLCLALAAVFGRPASAQTGFLQKTIDYNGASTKYVVYVPATYDATKPAPTILFLHGAGETGTDGWKQVAVGIGPAVLLDAPRWDFLVVFPQKPPGEQRGWIAHEKLILDILDKTRKEYAVDPSRLYCTGLSMGGAGTWALAAKHPNLFAAIAPICGPGDSATASVLKDLPIWAFYGDQDRAESIQRCRDLVEAVKTAGGAPKFTLYPGVGHNSWDKAYREEKLYDWFMQHRKP
jgi:predicted peptidase